MCTCLATVCHPLAATPTRNRHACYACVCFQPCMPFHTISRDLKAQIPVLFYRQGFKVKEVCSLLGVKKTLVYKMLSYSHAHGVSYNPYACKSGRKRVLSQGDLKFIVALLTCRHCIYLDEIQTQLSNECGVSISIVTLVNVSECGHTPD